MAEESKQLNSMDQKEPNDSNSIDKNDDVDSFEEDKNAIMSINICTYGHREPITDSTWNEKLRK